MNETSDENKLFHFVFLVASQQRVTKSFDDIDNAALNTGHDNINLPTFNNYNFNFRKLKPEKKQRFEKVDNIARNYMFESSYRQNMHEFWRAACFKHLSKIICLVIKLARIARARICKNLHSCKMS